MLTVTSNLVGPDYGNYGLGNQMFQVAALLSFAKDNDFKATFPILKDPKQGGYLDNFFRNVSTDEPESIRHCYTEPSFRYSPIPKFKFSFHVTNSYLQSEKYFLHNRQLILDTFKPNEDDLSYLKNKYATDHYDTSMHIRRGDYLHDRYSNHHTNLMTTGYYRKALHKLDASKVLLFCDEPEWAKIAFPEYMVVEEKDYMELYLMSLCKNNIIANSSFSWWGAWLNQNENKTVIAPDNWFGPSNNLPKDDIIPEDWVVV